MTRNERAKKPSPAMKNTPAFDSNMGSTLRHDSSDPLRRRCDPGRLDGGRQWPNSPCLVHVVEEEELTDGDHQTAHGSNQPERHRSDERVFPQGQVTPHV